MESCDKNDDINEFGGNLGTRPIIEHKNAELKRFHGMASAKYQGSSAYDYKLNLPRSL